MAFYFKNTKKDIIMTEKTEKDFKNKNICRFCAKEIIDNKVRDHCHLTGTSRNPAQNTCNLNVKQYDSYFIPIIFHKFGNYHCHMFFRIIVDMKNDKVNFDIIPKSNEEYISVAHGCIRITRQNTHIKNQLFTREI